MSSFLPLIEAFIALGLTMIVLTTGVSSLSGTWQRAIRARARGLRALLKCIWLLAVKAQARASNISITIEGDAALCRFVGEMSLLPAKLAEIAALAPVAQDPAFRRALPDLAPPGEDDPIATLRIWSSLADSLDTLSDDEFKTRFSASTVGTAIRDADPSGFDARLTAIQAQFSAHGHAASETYARDARRHSTVFAAILVLVANIDAFNLLETYLANPTLTAAIIDKYEKVATTGQATPSANPPPADANREATLKTFDERTKALLEATPAADKAKVVQTMKDARVLIETSLDTRDAARAVVADATSNFPVGWDRYPGCTRPESDPRCTALLKLDTPGASDSGQKEAGIFASLFGGLKSANPPPAANNTQNTATTTNTALLVKDSMDHLALAWDKDKPRALRWAAGLLLTILMLGLGAPFWIQTVNGLLRARDMARGGNKAGDGSKPDTPTTAAGK